MGVDWSWTEEVEMRRNNAEKRSLACV